MPKFPSVSGVPVLIQGGMGVAVSNWRLARAVSLRGQLGVVSGTAIDTVVVRRLQDGDAGGHIRRAMEHFPIPGVSETVLQRHYLPGGRPANTPYHLLPMFRQRVSLAREQVAILGAFVEVWLAKEGHEGKIGMNLLTKLQMPNLAHLYGAILAGVDYVLMGAGIPREIPGALDALAAHRPAQLRFDIETLPGAEPELLTFDPSRHWSPPAPLARPLFLAIVAASSLAATLARKATGRVDGFVVEGPTAGGHNAPPRGELRLSELGEPIYGDRDAVDLSKLAELGLPFWLAGGSGSPGALRAALRSGAAGVQVGTLFAWCDESGVPPGLKRFLLRELVLGRVSVFTDPRASPTGYPFKVVQVGGDVTQTEARPRECDLGYLRTPFRRADGRVGYRCPSEPVDDYLAKGGELGDTIGRRCLCNGLIATVGYAQPRGAEEPERPLLTSGDDIDAVRRLLANRESYGAADVMDYLLGEEGAEAAEGAEATSASPGSAASS